MATIHEQFSWLLSSTSDSLQNFIWQADFKGVVNFAYEYFKLRSQMIGVDAFGSSQLQ